MNSLENCSGLPEMPNSSLESGTKRLLTPFQRRAKMSHTTLAPNWGSRCLELPRKVSLNSCWNRVRETKKLSGL